MKPLELETDSPEATRKTGEQLGKQLGPGEVLALCGALGSGKTVFVQGLARGMDTDPGVLVTSPSFVILHEYPGRLNLYHFDFYRLSGEREVRELGYEEYFDGNGVCAVEWADKFPDLFGPGTWWVHFAATSESTRRIEFRPGPKSADEKKWRALKKALEG